MFLRSKPDRVTKIAAKRPEWFWVVDGDYVCPQLDYQSQSYNAIAKGSRSIMLYAAL